MSEIPGVYMVFLKITDLPVYSRSGMDLETFVSQEINPRADPLLARLRELGVQVRTQKVSRSLLIKVDASPEQLAQAQEEGLIDSNIIPDRNDVGALASHV